jgi:hypothetical protein
MSQHAFDERGVAAAYEDEAVGGTGSGIETGQVRAIAGGAAGSGPTAQDAVGAGPGAAPSTNNGTTHTSTTQTSTGHTSTGHSSPGHGARDLAADAVGAFAEALTELAEDSRRLEARLRALDEGRSAGRQWREILADEEPPGTMQLVSKMLGTLAKASGTLRKEMVESLRREGVSIPAIARLFGVTHQRVSNLLRRPGE